MSIINFIRKNKYDATINFIDSKNIINLRKKIHIVIVDDEELDIVHNLKSREYNIYFKKDMNYTLEAEPFDIIILDIKGIAENYGSTMEGFALAEDIKKRYPNKQVYCFSGTVKPEIVNQIKNIDGFIPKDYDIDKWVEQLDTAIENYIDIDIQWSILEKQMKNNGIIQTDIDRIKSIYYKSFKIKRFDNIDNVLMGIIKNTKLMFSVLNSIFSLVNLLSEN